MGVQKYQLISKIKSVISTGFNPSSALGVYQFSQILRYLASMLSSVIIARSSLPVEIIGRYELIIFIIAAATTFWSAGIKNALLSRFASLSADERLKEVHSILFLLLILSAITAILVYVFLGHLDFINTVKGDWPSFFLIGSLLFMSVPGLMTENILYLDGKLLQLKRYAIWSQVGFIVLIAAVAVMAPSLNSFLWVLLIWNFIKCIYLIVGVINLPFYLPERRRLLSLLLFSGPLILQAFLGQLMDLTDGFLVSHFFSEADFAIYRYGARELPFAALLFSSLSAAFIPLYQSESSALLQLKEKATLWMHRLFIPALILMVISPFLFKWVYGTAFQASATVFNLYLLILLSRVFLPQTINFALHQHRILLIASCSEIVINIILSLWWLQILGLTGLVAATVVAYACEKLILIVYNYRYNKISPASYIDLRWYLGYAVIFLLLTALMFIWNH
jgi:O-antigen/teichoic acid export membrane protein